MSVALKKKKKKEDISKKILSSFKKKGFNFIDLDMVIDTDLLTRRSGEAFKKYALNFKDNSGKEISLRPDLTIATAIQYIQNKRQVLNKISYYGSAFRLDKKGKLNVFDQIGCEIINSKSAPEQLVLTTILSSFRSIQKKEIIINDLSLFSVLVNLLNLPKRWKLRLIRHYSRKDYFNELLRRLETSYDLDQKKIKIDYNRLSELKRLNQKKIIGGRSVGDIVSRFEKKIKDPRDNFNGSQSVKIIQDFLKIRVSFKKLKISLNKFCTKHNLDKSKFNNNLKKLSFLNSSIRSNETIIFDTKFGRDTQYYTGFAFSLIKKKKELARGGEYNNLIKTLGGKQTPAFGAAININNLI